MAKLNADRTLEILRTIEGHTNRLEDDIPWVEDEELPGYRKVVTNF